MTADIYEQHKAAFSNVSAFIIIDAKGSPVASVAFKYPRDGAGRLYAYAHVYGSTMQRGFASGYGYDKHSPAVCAAFDKIEHNATGVQRKTRDHIEEMRAAMSSNGGEYWNRLLEKAGYRVQQVV